MADIPGIIEGASEGKGLGLRFLRHIERNAVLLFMVPADSDDIRKDYEILLNELKEFNPELADKSRVLAISKSDMLEDNKNNFTITHRKLDTRHRVQEEDDFIFEQEEPEEDDFSDMTDEDWNEEFWDEESTVNPE